MGNNRRNRIRFSLRTVLIITTGLCLLLGFKVKQLRDRRAALSAIDALGAGYSVRIEGPNWLRKLVGDEKTFYNLGRVSLGPICKDYDVSLNFDDVLRETIPHINKFSDFHRLHIASSPVTDEGLLHLKNLKSLKQLDISNTQISDSGLDILANCKSLTRILMPNTAVTSDGVAKFQAACPNCEVAWDGS